MITLKEIAEITGVSVTTVSRVLNKSAYNDRVSKETAERIRAVAEEQKYVPNSMAQAIKNKKTNYIAVVTININDPFFSELFEQIKDRLNEYGFNTMLFTLKNRAATENDITCEAETEIINRIKNWNLDGAIFCYPDMYGNIDNLAKLYCGEKGIVVPVFERPKEKKYYHVQVNLAKGATEAMEYFIGKGLTHIAYLGNLKTQDIRRRVYIETLKKHSIPVIDGYMVHSLFDVSDGYRATQEILHSGLPLQAVFTVNDMVAIGSINCLMSNGIKVPEQVSVIGVDDIKMAEFAFPSLSTVRQSSADIADELVKNVICQIRHIPYTNMVIDTSLILRDSTFPEGSLSPVSR